MNLKVGDKLVCKRSDIIFKDHPLFIVGNSYELVEIKDPEYLISIDNIKWHFSEFNIKKYFYSRKELRNKKLQKLREYESR